MMLYYMNPRLIHLLFRCLTTACLSVFVGHNIYQYYRTRNLRLKKLISDSDKDDNEHTTTKETNQSHFNDRKDDLSTEETDSPDDEEFSESETEEDVVDIEDIGPGGDLEKKHDKENDGTVRTSRRSKKVKTQKPVPRSLSQMTEEQITDKLRTDLTKQGYKLIQTHSAVKMCRWTKNSMRGRGGCYKHTFYGIKSYQCMEMTPNLACASKCTFCWRHHKNPVGTEWRWKMDAPDVIVEEALKNHEDMIKQFKGVPGVTIERFTDAQTVRHCALSLVGEPIFYPKINELLEILHSRQISTFLVTNAQFPEAMRNLVPVTQLYVSIDAPNRETLKKIDRPLYKDFWERYLECLNIISERKQRTVFRLTLVQKSNMDDLKGYAELIKIGKPDFIEIKGVTYCGTSKANKLTMENVPWHEQVVEFGESLSELLDKETYELACEHSHSNCLLIANTKFKINSRWHTWIDYGKFFELVGSGKEFTSLDYMAETPSWAIFGSPEGGFDPDHMRWIRKEHKLKLLKERIADQQRNCCSSESSNVCDATNGQTQTIELNSA